ncbi:polysaccharide pyruvyl transferase family protein [Parabacteroides pacaensis]|uniref:polysaccharide pyruvyl transferase family protein n=1 Tax=Parabacteroides pacaensis TaxID=2086575 RepID=UPI000D113AF6|nr:polysaccharide pyruvyl transferase family protein [Parabacteroides pacaensis]
MKKIGIITYFHFYNYGTVLQAFALESLISKMGSTVCELINYEFQEIKEESKIQIVKTRLKRLLYYLFNLKRIITTYTYRKEMNRRIPFFEQFIKSYFRLSSNKYLYYTDLLKNPLHYDIYFTGSDQTWSPKIGFNPALFLNFADKQSIKAAYAPSVGVTSFTETEEIYLKEQLSKYDYLSCRETIGANLLSGITGKNVQVVLDPTLMITKEEWRKLTVKPKIKNPYILCYFLGHRQYYRNFVNKLAIQTGYDTYFIPVSYVDCKKTNSLLFDVGPAEFIGLIDQAAIVCTDSFHGLCFSINLNKEFYAFVKHEGAVDGGDNSRIYDLLNRMDLLLRLKSDFRETDIRMDPIDYIHVSKLLEKERKISKDFLHKVLNETDK